RYIWKTGASACARNTRCRPLTRLSDAQSAFGNFFALQRLAAARKQSAASSKENNCEESGVPKQDFPRCLTRSKCNRRPCFSVRRKGGGTKLSRIQGSLSKVALTMELPHVEGGFDSQNATALWLRAET